jgi:hypothetical protein
LPEVLNEGYDRTGPRPGLSFIHVTSGQATCKH